jgi:hypothetical protein
MRPVTPSDYSSRYSTKRLSISAAAFLSGSSAAFAHPRNSISGAAPARPNSASQRTPTLIRGSPPQLVGKCTGSLISPIAQ